MLPARNVPAGTAIEPGWRGRERESWGGGGDRRLAGGWVRGSVMGRGRCRSLHGRYSNRGLCSRSFAVGAYDLPSLYAQHHQNLGAVRDVARKYGREHWREDGRGCERQSEGMRGHDGPTEVRETSRAGSRARSCKGAEEEVEGEVEGRDGRLTRSLGCGSSGR